MARIETKRANFDLTPEQDEILASLRTSLSASSTKDTVLRAVHLATVLVAELRQGNHLFVGRSATEASRLIIPELEAAAPAEWKWLVERPHPWRRQLWVKGRKLLASTVWLNAQTNQLDVQETAEDWELPLEAVEEIFDYCDANRDLIAAEAQEERQRLLSSGKPVEQRVAA
jgi:hypothetical protein